MLKKFESWESLEPSEPEYNFKKGDIVIVTSKSSYHYNRVLIIDEIISKQVVVLVFHYDNVKNKYLMNKRDIQKVKFIIGERTGEVLVLKESNFDSLFEMGFIDYDIESRIYTFDESNRWRIDKYILKDAKIGKM